MKVLAIVGGEVLGSIPMGMAYLLPHIKNHTVQVFLAPHHPISKLYPTLSKFKPDVVLLSFMTHDWAQLESILDIISLFRCYVVAGGPLFLAQGDLAMQTLPSIDVCCLGEGEFVLPRVLNSLGDTDRLSTIPGILYRKNGEIESTGRPERIENLDSLPYPNLRSVGCQKYWQDVQLAREGVDLSKSFWGSRSIAGLTRPGPILGSRGCSWSQCTFCDNLYHRYIERSVPSILAEIEYQIEEYGIQSIEFMDSLLSPDVDRLMDIARGVKKFGLPWSCKLRADVLTNPDVLSELSGCNLKYVMLGIESMSNTILSSMKKGVSRETLDGVLSSCRDHGIHCWGNVILGDPQETWETSTSSVKYVVGHPQFNMNVDFIKLVPNSPMYRKYFCGDAIQHNRDHFPVINISKLSTSQWDFLRRFARLVFLGMHYSLVTGDVTRSGDHFQVACTCPHCNLPTSFQSPLPIIHVCGNCSGTLRLRLDQFSHLLDVDELHDCIGREAEYQSALEKLYAR